MVAPEHSANSEKCEKKYFYSLLCHFYIFFEHKMEIQSPLYYNFSEFPDGNGLSPNEKFSFLCFNLLKKQ